MDANSQSPQVRGVTSNFAKASKLWRLVLFLRNATCLGAVALVLVQLSDTLPTASLLATLLLVSGVGAFAGFLLESRVRKLAGNPRSSIIVAALGTMSCMALLIWGAGSHPLWSSAGSMTLAAWEPGAEGRNWRPTGYFYAVGFWPESVGGNPVLPLIPYQKGPPEQFLGRITLRWNWPEVKVHIDGPKTPGLLGKGEMSREELRACLEKKLFALVFSQACQSLRAEIWTRLSPAPGKVRWFEVEQNRLNDSERAQGLWIESRQANGVTYRQAILVNAKGALQKLTLEVAPGRDAKKRESDIEAFTQVIRSLRVTSDLGITRTIADHDLLGIQIGAMGGASLEAVARAQALLASKLSVDPGATEAYFHLAGSAWIATRAAGSPPELASWAKAQVQAVQAYLRDVAPNSPRLTEVESLAAQLRGI